MAGKTPLSQQVVVIAGGSYGLGRAIARAAADRGAKIVVGARTREALDAAVCEVEAAGSQGLAVEADVSRRGDVERLVRAAVERFGHVDTYVANAMVTVYAEAHRLADDELRRVMDVNFFGGVYGFWSALPELRKSRGTFVQIASALSYRAIPLQASGPRSPSSGSRAAPSCRSPPHFRTAPFPSRLRTARARRPCAGSSRARASSRRRSDPASTSA